MTQKMRLLSLWTLIKGDNMRLMIAVLIIAGTGLDWWWLAPTIVVYLITLSTEY